jgi:hypothetical protein
MRARRMRRRLFNLFAFALLAFAIYLVKFSKEEPMYKPGQETVKTINKAKTGTIAGSH